MGFERLGQEQRAAELQANAAAILIENSVTPDRGLRDVQNALAVSRRLGNRNFEVLGAQLTAAYYRSAGRIRLGQTLARLNDADGARREFAQAEADVNAGTDPELVPLLNTAIGVFAYESGDPAAARERFQRSAALWTDDFPDVASVEARAYLGLLDGLDRRDTGATQVRTALEQASRMGRLTLQARCHVFLAQLAASRGRFDEAARELDQMPADTSTRTIDAALRREADAVRSRVQAARRN
jgi:tetratricopeptide (TPR) repeat protein